MKDGVLMIIHIYAKVSIPVLLSCCFARLFVIVLLMFFFFLGVVKYESLQGRFFGVL